MKISLRTISTWVGFILLGVVLTIAGLILALYLREGPSEEEIKGRVALNYAAYTQKAMGVRCTEVRASLKNLLQTKVGPIIRTRKDGETWYLLVSTDLKNDLKRHDQFVSTCARLYMTGEAGKFNDLQSIGYIEKAYEDFSTLSTLLLYAEKSEEMCNKKCLDAKFNILAVSYERLVSVLEEKSAMESNSLFDADFPAASLST
jgi:hypothetical protein